MEIARAMMHQIGSGVELSLIPEVIIGYSRVFLVMLFGFFIHWMPEVWKEKITKAFIASPLWLKIIIAALVVIIVYQSISADMQPFIYFQF